MPKTEEGEFELVLGNKQLLSVFFIVVVLLGVFFTMGYIVGRNTGGSTTEMASTPGQPLIVEPGAGAASSQPPAAAAPKPAATPAKPAAARPKPPAAKPTATPKPTPPPKATPTPKPTPPPKRPTSAPSGVSVPAAGQTFLQVVATSRSEGEVVRDLLRKRGFQARLAPVPDQDIVRVLVGPVSGQDDLAQTRDKLREAGFKPFARKY